MINRLQVAALVFAGTCLGGVIGGYFEGVAHPLAYAQNGDPKSLLGPELAAELEAIKSKLPDQAHAMQDVGYHFTNLWFAGKHAHWDLANFYLAETRSHLRWAVRIIPKRKDSAGQEIDLQAILQAVENTPLKQLEDSIKAKDGDAFEKAYRFTLESCYSCHKASDKPFIRPQIPTHPETLIINFDPNATWPK
jgi:hypothetical protein